MSRAASMQVLNQAFNNLTNAMIAYKRNEQNDRRLALDEEFGRLDREFRQLEAMRNQNNQDRTYDYNLKRDAQAQENFDRNNAFRISEATRNQANFDKGFNYKNERDKVADSRYTEQFKAGQQNAKNKLLLKKLELDLKAHQLANSQSQNQANTNLKNLISMVNATKSSGGEVNIPQMIKDYQQMSALLKGGNLTQQQVQAMVENGEMTREEAYKISKQNGWVK